LALPIGDQVLLSVCFYLYGVCARRRSRNMQVDGPLSRIGLLSISGKFPASTVARRLRRLSQLLRRLCVNRSNVGDDDPTIMAPVDAAQHSRPAFESRIR
jgi:hypothetical protein